MVLDDFARAFPYLNPYLKYGLQCAYWFSTPELRAALKPVMDSANIVAVEKVRVTATLPKSRVSQIFYVNLLPSVLCVRTECSDSYKFSIRFATELAEVHGRRLAKNFSPLLESVESLLWFKNQFISWMANRVLSIFPFEKQLDERLGLSGLDDPHDYRRNPVAWHMTSSVGVFSKAARGVVISPARLFRREWLDAAYDVWKSALDQLVQIELVECSLDDMAAPVRSWIHLSSQGKIQIDSRALMSRHAYNDDKGASQLVSVRAGLKRLVFSNKSGYVLQPDPFPERYMAKTALCALLEVESVSNNKPAKRL